MSRRLKIDLETIYVSRSGKTRERIISSITDENGTEYQEYFELGYNGPTSVKVGDHYYQTEAEGFQTLEEAQIEWEFLKKEYEKAVEKAVQKIRNIEDLAQEAIEINNPEAIISGYWDDEKDEDEDTEYVYMSDSDTPYHKEWVEAINSLPRRARYSFCYN